MELIKSLQYLLFFEVLLVEVKGVELHGDVHRVTHLNAGNGLGAVGEHGSQFDSVWDKVHLVVHSLALGVDDEDLWVVFAFEIDLLQESFVDVGSEHNVNCLLLTWKKGAAERINLETLTSFFAFFRGRDIGFEEVLPIAGNLFVILEANLDSLACVDTNFEEVEL